MRDQVTTKPHPREYQISYTWNGERFVHPVGDCLTLEEAKEDLALLREDGRKNAHIVKVC